MQFQPGKERLASAAEAVHSDRLALGMGASLASFLLLTIMNVFAKLLSSRHPVIEVAFYRNLIALLPFAAWFFLLGHREGLIVNGKVAPLLLRSVIGTASLIATFSAFSALPLADAQALFFTSSLFIPIMGYVFLKERVGPYRWGAVLVGFIGMLIIVRPTGSVNIAGVSYALTAAFMHASLGTLLRLLGRTERPETVTFYFLAIGAVLTGLAMPWVATVPAWSDLPFFLGAGLAGACAQMSLSVAYKFAPAALATLFNYTGIVWSAAFGWLIWDEWPAPPVWTGAAIIIASSLFIIWRENRLTKLKKIAEVEEANTSCPRKI